MKKINITDKISLVLGATEEEEQDEFFDSNPLPEIVFVGEYAASLPFENKETYESFTIDLFWYLASEGKLKCPRCQNIMDYENDPGDSSVGMPGYIMANCTNKECYYFEIETKEKEEELIREVFPFYWKWESDNRMEKIKCSFKEATELKVKIGNLIDLFPTGRIRKKDMPKFNKELNAIMSVIIDEKSAKF